MDLPSSVVRTKKLHNIPLVTFFFIFSKNRLPVEVLRPQEKVSVGYCTHCLYRILDLIGFMQEKVQKGIF